MLYHIDFSNNYTQKNFSVVGLVSSFEFNQKNEIFNKKNVKKAIVIEEPLRTKIINSYSITKLHSILITFLIENLKDIKKIIICADVQPIEKVIEYLIKINPQLNGKLTSIPHYREEIHNPKYKSEADAFARSVNRNYKKRKNRHRRKKLFDDIPIITIKSETSEEYKRLSKIISLL